MDGSVYEYIKSKKKHYYVSYRIENLKTGKKEQKTKKGFRTKAEANEFLTTIHNKEMTGTYIHPEEITLGEYLTEWLKIYVEPNLKQATVDGYRRNIEKHVIPEIGGIKIQKLKAFHIQELYLKKLAGDENGENKLSAKSILYIHRNLSQALKHAEKQRLVPRNVAEDVTPPRVPRYRSQIFNVSEIKQLLDVSKGTEFEIPITLSVLLGLRRGEVLGLTWNHVDMENYIIRIDQQLSKSSKGPAIDTTKTESSNRTVIFGENIHKMLRNEKKKQQLNKLQLGIDYKNGDFVVSRFDGGFVSPDSLTKGFKRFLKKNNLKHIRFHDLRHSFASLMISSGHDLKLVSEIMGHSSIKVTADVYGHVLDETKRKAASNVDNLIFGEAVGK